MARGAGLLALVTVVAACSSSGDGAPAKSSNPPSASNSTGATSQSSSATATGTPIKVGLICSCAGSYGAYETAASNVFDAWVQSVNAAGGVEGHPVKVTKVDDGTDPGKAVTGIQKLIDAKVAVILDNSLLTAAWEKTITAAKIPVVGGTAVSDAFFFTNPNFYPSGQTQDATFTAVVAAAKDAGADKIGNFYCAEAPVCAETINPLKAVGQQLGVPQAYTAAISATAPNYTAQCLAAKQAGVTAIFGSMDQATFSRVAADCHRQGFDPMYIVNATTYAPSMNTAPGLGDKLRIIYPDRPYWDSATEVNTMNGIVDQYYPGMRENNKGGQWSQSAITNWTAGLLIASAVKGAGVDATGTVDAAAMVKGLQSIKDNNLDGWSPALTFTAGQPNKADCWFAAKIDGGKPALVKDQPICQSEVS